MIRRKFIQNLAWLTGGIIFTACSPEKLAAGETRKRKGYVKSGGNGIPGVVISDGYNVVTTDAKGKYELEQHPDALSIFISTPAGYAFKNEDSIARHYRLLSSVSGSKDVDFDLVPLGKSDLEHQFIIWADPQVKNKSDVEKMMTQSVPDVKKWIADAGPDALIHGITVGDIVWDELEYFADYNMAVKEMGVPFFQCLGNHDMDYRKGGDETSDDTFNLTYGPSWYSFNRGKAHYVVLDDVRYLGTERDYDGHISQAQLNWLAKDLSYVPNDHLIILCLHIPVHNGVKNNSDLYAILKDRNVHIMSGHTHYNINVEQQNIYEHNHGTVCGAWWTGKICGDGTPSGYGVYTVKGNELSWQYKSVGESIDHQFSIHTKKLEDNSNEVLVNIWNHDSAWQTNYAVDGVQKGSLEQIEGFDPVAYATLLGPDLPKPRGFAEPRKTNHLFKAILPATASQVTVTATDRFGKQYTSTRYL